MIWPFKIFEKKTLSNPTEEEFALFSGGAVSGTISIQMALTVPAVQSAIRLISEAAACLDLRVEQRIAGKWVKDEGHPVAELLCDQPNAWSSTFELVRDQVATALCHDKGGLAYVNRVGSEVREIVRYEPSHFTVDYSGDGRLEPTFRINNTVISGNNIFHLRSPFSRSPLSLASAAIGAAKDMESHAVGLFKNAARPSGVIQFPKSLGDDGLKNMKAGWKAAHEGPANAGKTAILWDGAQWIPMTMNSTDGQFLENRTFQILEVARAFRVPPSMLYEMSRVTWSNGEQMGREFLVYSLEPWLQGVEGGMRRSLFTPEERPNWRVRFDRDDLTRADLGSRATAYSSLISARVINPNEARDWEGLPPYAGGESFINPNISTQAETPPAPEPTDGP